MTVDNSFYDNFRQAIDKPDAPPKPKAGWLDPIMSAGGAIVGFTLGGPPGAVAGYNIGHGVGDTAEGAINHDLTAERLKGNTMSTYSGAQGLQGSSTAPPQGAHESILNRYNQNPKSFLTPNPPSDQWGQPPMQFDSGGQVPPTGPSMGPISPQAMALIQKMLAEQQAAQSAPPASPAPVSPPQAPQGPQMASLEASGASGGQGAPPNMLPVTPETIQQYAAQIAGTEPTAPAAAPLQQAKHPLLEALGQIAPGLLASLPKPADPRNTKAIGAWMPFVGNALAAPGAVAAARRRSANAPIVAGNDAAKAKYEADKKAWEARKIAATGPLMTAALRRDGTDGSTNGLDLPMDKPTAKRVTGSEEWAGMTLRQWNSRNKPPAMNPNVTGGTISPRAIRVGKAVIAGTMSPRYAAAMFPSRDPDRAGLADYLASRGYDANKAEFSIVAEKKYWQTQNDSKRTTIRTQLNTLAHTIPYTRSLIAQAKDAIPDFSVSGFNNITLQAAANLPGPRGVLARKLIAQIGDIGAEVGTLYMGGNSNTDESFRLAAQNLKSDWSEEQLSGALDQIEMNTGIRANAMRDIKPYKPEPNTPIKSVDDY